MKIDTNKYVVLSYDLNVGEEGEELELMERATAEKPLEFIFGTNSMLPAFEKNLEGLDQGDNFQFTLSSEEAYGEYDENKIIELPKNIFQVDGKIDEEILFEGNTVPMMDSEGNRLTGSIVSIGDDVVVMDFNHPLAGETMHFKGTVLNVRDASAEEIAALFSGGGCSCGSDSCGCGGESEGCGCGSSECNC
jgi:FKBP-type peptidyl-prolyl cis-trans isomerase SlyD